MILNKELAIGIYSSTLQKKEFSVSWNSGTTRITAYNPGQPIGENDFDRPRINTFRTDGTFVVYASAGQVVYNPVTNTTSTPWGDRRVGTLNLNIPLHGSLSAGVDFFTDDRLPTPVFSPPIGQWSVETTGNPNERKYQYIINRLASSVQNISISF